jgi:signal transduction histidine kinase
MHKVNGKKSIRDKLIAVNLYQATIPMIILALFLMLTIAFFAFLQMIQRSNDIMHSIEVASNRYLNQYNSKLDEVYSVISHYENPNQIDDLLDVYVQNSDEIMSLLILDSRGISIHGAPKTVVNLNYDYSGHKYFKILKESGDLFWSDVFIVRESNIPMVSISKRIDDITLVLQVNLEVLTSFLNTFDISEHSYIAITDQSGTYLAHSDYNFVTIRGYDPNRKNLLVKGSDYLKYEDRCMLAFHEHLEKNNWSILYYQSVWDTVSPLLYIILIGLMVILFIGTGVLKSVIKLNNELSNEVQELVSWSKTVATGAYDIQIKKSSITEFNNLYDAFDIMTKNVLSREKELEYRRYEIIQVNKGLELEVKNRTLELEKSLENLQKTQAQLIQKEKMASLGRLVSGVAHELNTPIGVALTAITYLEQKNNFFLNRLIDQTMTKQDLETYMTVINDSTEIVHRNMNRASELITNFKRVAIDQEKMAYEKTNIQEVIEATITSLSVEIKRKLVTTILSFEGNLTCESYPGAISQVITNLVQNSLLHAFDAVIEPEIGIECHENLEDQSIVIHYWDNGKGIKPEELDKIYDPFYTTAEGSGGTGLGLNIVYNLVTGSLMGDINYKTTTENGVFFEIILPKKALIPSSSLH